MVNKISITAKGDKVTYSKIIGAKIVKVVANTEKALFWAKMYATMSDFEGIELADNRAALEI